MRLPQGEYWMYLRKSRADLEAEARGEGETLAKHRKALLQLAKDRNLTITEIFAETASGESILHRPEMLRMLKALEAKPPAGVLVMDIDRFGRGDKIDQGIIERTFKESNTLIVTPIEIFDMNNEAGEFNVEVRSFLARMELKQITKRMQGGRRRSVEEGNYLGTRPPFGYELHQDNVGRTLIPHSDQADIVRLIFSLYTHDDPSKRAGSSKIATKLNQLKVPTYSGKAWEASTVLSILKNEVYIGRIQWGKKRSSKSKVPGKRKEVAAQPRENWIDIQGRHKSLIEIEVFAKAQHILGKKYHVPYQLVNGITNPLAGLIRCGYCGSSMVYRPYVNADAHIMCTYKTCDNKSSKYAYVESKLLEGLESWMKDYRNKWLNYKPDEDHNPDHDIRRMKTKLRKEKQQELDDLSVQKNNLFDLLERGVYNEELFLTRSKEIAERIQVAEQSIADLTAALELDEKRNQVRHDIIPKIESAIILYHNTTEPSEKNFILKSVVDYCIYKKEKNQRNDDFSLVVFPQFPD